MKADTAIYSAFEEHVARDIALNEKNLMRAILQSAIEDMEKTGEFLRQARQFFVSNDDQYIYSFLNICYQLEICPQTVRNKLRVPNSKNQLRYQNNVVQQTV